MFILDVFILVAVVSIFFMFNLLFGFGIMGKLIFLMITLCFSLAPILLKIQSNTFIFILVQKSVINIIKKSFLFPYITMYFSYLYRCTYAKFLCITWSNYAIFIIYLGLGKYLLYLEIQNLELGLTKPFFLIILFMIFQTGFILRLFHNFTIFIIGHLILTEGFTPEPPDYQPKNNYSLYHRSQHYHNHNHNAPPDWGRKMAMHARGNWLAAGAGLVLSSGALYCYYQSVEGTWAQVHETRRQNDMTAKSQAQWEVDHGLRTKSEYEKEFPKKKLTLKKFVLFLNII